MQEINEQHVHSLGELLDYATPTKPDPVSGRLRDSAVYRGVADSRWKLLTSLDRLGGISPPHTKVHLERHILRNFIRYSRPYLGREIANEWETLIHAQHHGLPTRLLDWTYSPLVGAHFATLHHSSGTDCVVWKLNWIDMHRRMGLQPVAFLADDLNDQLGIDSIWNLFTERGTTARPFLCMLEPPSLNARVIAQSAAFTLASRTDCSFDELLGEFGLSDLALKIIIPSESVSRLRDQLDICSVDERRLFPDLDGVAAEMRRYYTSSPKEIAMTKDPR